MAVARNNSELPKDAVLLSENEALEFQFDLIKHWQNQKDV